jgi:hypothetical protein
MASSQLAQIDLEPDLTPLYPTPAVIAPLLSPNSGFSPSQKSRLVSHCLTRACVFGEPSLLAYLLQDSQAQQFIDLSAQDDDGLSLISTTILGFGSDPDRDIEREECIRMLLSEGASMDVPDKGTYSDISWYTSVDSSINSSWLDTVALCGPTFSPHIGVPFPEIWMLAFLCHSSQFDRTRYCHCSFDTSWKGNCRIATGGSDEG